MAAERRITRQLEAIVRTLATNPTAEWAGTDIARLSGLKSGTLYPALLRMHRFGWLVWHWEKIDPSEAKRPRRRLYSLTGSGEQAVQRIMSESAARQKRQLQRKQALRPVPRGATA